MPKLIKPRASTHIRGMHAGSALLCLWRRAIWGRTCARATPPPTPFTAEVLNFLFYMYEYYKVYSCKRLWETLNHKSHTELF